MQLGERRFTEDDQRAFSRLSGDRNPMHLDPLAARRTQAGAPVVHGIHGALWALDRLAATGASIGPVLQLRFEAFLYLDVPVEAALRTQGDKRSVVLESGGRRVTTITLAAAGEQPPSLAPGAEPEAIAETPVELDFAAASTARGALALAGSLADYATAFPRLAQAIGPERVRAIGGLSTLVGMRVPGLHSIFSKCRIVLMPEPGSGDALAFGVTRAREPLRQLNIAFSGSGIAGSIDAFVRHPPVRQPSLADLAPAAVGLDLAGQRALIVGGSRGLGELTAKLAALAGAAVTVTYATGSIETARLCAEFAERGLPCRAKELDVRRLAEAELAAGEFTHLYYFATPPIFKRSVDHYDPQQFATFVTFYCDAFVELCRRLRGDNGLTAFWPSSTAIDEKLKGSIEYVMAKLAGEALCDDLNRSEPGLRIGTCRFPRLPTDQTASVTPARTADPVELIRRVLADLA